MPDHQALVHVKTGTKLADGWDDPLTLKELGVSAGDEIVLVLNMTGRGPNRKYEPDLCTCQRTQSLLFRSPFVGCETLFLISLICLILRFENIYNEILSI
jgi:hypothetical protein